MRRESEVRSQESESVDGDMMLIQRHQLISFVSPDVRRLKE